MELSDQIIAKLRLKSELTEVLLSLEAFTASFFVSTDQKEITLRFDRLPNGIGELLKTAFLQTPVTVQNENTIKKQIEKIQQELQTCTTLELTLAFQPDQETITIFAEWVKKNVNPRTLIDLRFDKTLIGGALLVSRGVYKDFSIRKTLSNKFQIQKEEIMKLLD